MIRAVTSARWPGGQVGKEMAPFLSGHCKENQISNSESLLVVVTSQVDELRGNNIRLEPLPLPPGSSEAPLCGIGEDHGHATLTPLAASGFERRASTLDRCCSVATQRRVALIGQARATPTVDVNNSTYLPHSGYPNPSTPPKTPSPHLGQPRRTTSIASAPCMLSSLGWPTH